jgi:hypothetical protein
MPTVTSSVAFVRLPLPTADVPYYPQPQLPASNSNISQRLYLSSSDTDEVTNNFSSLTPLNGLNFLTALPVTSRHPPHIKRRSSVAVSNCCRGYTFANRYLVATVVYLLISRSLPSNGSTCHVAPFLRLVVSISIHAQRHLFFSEGCACDVCDLPRIPFTWLSSHGD